MAKDLSGKMGAVLTTDGMPRSITVEKVHKALVKSGLDPETAQKIGKLGCFARAKSKLSADGLILEVCKKDDEGRWLWQLSDTVKDKSNKVSLKFKAHFWLTEDGEVGSNDEAVRSKVEALFEEYGGIFLSADLMRIVHRIFLAQSGLLALRHAGGVYFVPEANRPLLEKVMTFLQDIGCVGCVVIPVGQLDNSTLKDKAVSMLVECTKNRLQGIQDEIKGIEGRKDGKLSRTVAKNRWKQLNGELERVRTFAKALAVDAQSLLKKAATSEIDLTKCATDTEDQLDIAAAMAVGGRKGSVMAAIANVVKEEGEKTEALKKKADEVTADDFSDTTKVVEEELPAVDVA